jgi:hypothetical protein
VNEHGFIRAVHGHLPPEVFRWKIHDRFAGGIPDAFYRGPACSLFVEYKYLKALPKNNNTELRTTLTASQIRCLDLFYQLQQPVALVIGVGQLAVVLQHGTWNQPITRQKFLASAHDFRSTANWIATHVGIQQRPPTS